MKAILLAAALAASQCNPAPAPQPEPYRPVPGEPSCLSACANLAIMSCPESLPTKAGATCEQVCANAIDNGLRLPLACLTAATSCGIAERCQ
jgi:hypothetical protein